MNCKIRTKFAAQRFWKKCKRHVKSHVSPELVGTASAFRKTKSATSAFQTNGNSLSYLYLILTQTVKRSTVYPIACHSMHLSSAFIKSKETVTSRALGRDAAVNNISDKRDKVLFVTTATIDERNQCPKKYKECLVVP